MIQPSSFAENIQDLPLLIISGEQDERIPIEDIRDFYKKASQVYIRKKNIKFIEYKDAGNTVIDDMLNKAAQWVIEHL